MVRAKRGGSECELAPVDVANIPIDKFWFRGKDEQIKGFEKNSRSLPKELGRKELT